MNEPAIFFEDVNERQGGFLRRTFVLGGGMMLGLGALAVRLADLQIVEHDRYKDMASANQWNFRLTPPPRGRILDRNGVVLADNRPSFRLLVIRDETKDLDATLDQVGKLIPATLDRRRQLIREINQANHGVPVAVATDLTWEEFSKVNLHVGEMPGVESDMNEARYYPYGGAFAHVIGYVSKVSDADVKAAKAEIEKKGGQLDPMLLNPGFRIGKQGIEKALDEELRGRPGGRKVEVDARGRVVREDPEGDHQPVPGAEVVLTLDADVQNRALEVFGSDSGACVVMDCHTGDILCLLSAPGFDANAFVSGIPGKIYKALSEYDHKPLLNKALSGTYPAGSTFKTMVALTALARGISPSVTHTCNGVFPFGNHVFKCDKHHGTLDMHGAIVTSCDVFFYNTALAVGPDAIAATARKFGINQLFDLGIPGQHKGILPDQEWKRKTFVHNPANQKWFPGETPSFGIGQGYLAVNPLQLCVMASRLANGDKMINPRLIKSIGGVERPRGSDAPDLPFDRGHLAFIQKAMADVVTSGTAASTGKLGLGSVAMAGKTGTAQSHSYTSGHGAHGAQGAWALRDHGWFIAFAPADAPRYAMSVLVEHGGFGGEAAAPKAREIMRTVLLKDPEVLKRIQSSGGQITAAPASGPAERDTADQADATPSTPAPEDDGTHPQ
jgi:penicillin-binding protein 2